MSPSYTVYLGTFIQLPRTSPAVQKPHLDVHTGALWVDNGSGKIAGFDWNLPVEDDEAIAKFIKEKGWVIVPEGATPGQGGGGEDATQITASIVKSGRNGFFFPGFIDTHIHAPQYPNRGLFGSTTLLEWLEKYTFPTESSYGTTDDEPPPEKASSVYKRVISRTLAHGTTTASYFATIHVPATNLLADLCYQRGQRAFIGRVCMENPEFCPEYYKDESVEESISRTKSTIEYIQKIDPKGTLVAPIVTPRFALSCSSAALAGLGKLAKSYDPPLRIQTHVSENTNEVKLVKEQFPQCASYTHVYDDHGLLTPRTILAHGIHLTRDERQLIHDRKAKIAHCPTSNSALGSGICPVRSHLSEGLTVGLGTDVSGGYSPNILEVARQACLVSRLLTSQASSQTKYEPLSWEEALYLATRGGAAVVDMADQIGGFEEGMFWDTQLIDLGPLIDENSDTNVSFDAGNVDIFGWESWEEKIEKWMWCGDDRNVKKVWVNGKLVHQR